MGAFLLTGTQPVLTQSIQQALNALQQQGFVSPRCFEGQGWQLHLFGKLSGVAPQFWQQDKGNFCACCGTLIYRGMTGTAALQRFYQDFEVNQLDYRPLYGAFVLLLAKQGRLFVLQDRLGVYKLYLTAEQQLLSSSFLAAAYACGSELSLNAQGVYEYVFQEAVNGEHTVLSQVVQLDADLMYCFEQQLQPVSGAAPVYHDEGLNADIVQLRQQCCQQLTEDFANIRACFPNIDTALSGGYDSRLMLALLRQAGVSAEVHVYGAANSPDVIVASRIDQHEQLGLRHIDKANAAKIDEQDYAALVWQNYLLFDGCPADGIFDNGSDLLTRRERCAEGKLLLNGGGGEIFRNFFYLPNKPLSVDDFLATFYAQFDPQVTTSRFNDREYYACLEHKVQAVLDSDSSELRRQQIEMLYPLFRCRYWMGKNNSINNRLGFMLTPFIDLLIVRLALQIPLAEKNFGKFQASLIQTIDPVLAAYPSDYGHSFVEAPNLKHKVKDMATICRPIWLRRRSYRLKNRRRQLHLPYWLSPSYLQQVMAADFPYMQQYFQLDNVTDSAMYARICTLEYLCQQLQPKADKS